MGPYTTQLLGEKMHDLCSAFGMADVRVDFEGGHASGHTDGRIVKRGEVIEL